MPLRRRFKSNPPSEATPVMPQRAPLIFLVVSLAALLPFLLQIAWPFLTVFLLSSILAIVVNPANRWLLERIHRPALATFLTTFATVLIVGITLAVASVTITRELTAVYNALNRRSLEEGGWPALATHTADRVVDALATRIPIDKEAIRTELIERMRDASAYVLNHIGSAAGGLTTAAFSGLMVTIFLYFLLRYGSQWIDRLAALTPLDCRTTTGILRTINDSVIANVNGVFAAVVGQGLFLILGFWFVGLRAPLFWGVVGGFASILPVLGAPLIWVPVAIGFLFMGAYWKALILFLWCSLIVGSIDNLVRPLVVGAREEQHPVLIALAAIGGTFAFGPLGILFGPLLISLAAALFKEIRTLLARSHEAAQDAETFPPGPTAKGTSVL